MLKMRVKNPHEAVSIVKKYFFSAALYGKTVIVIYDGSSILVKEAPFVRPRPR